MAAGNRRHAPKGARGRARTWIVLAALLLLLCTGTLMLALSDPQEDAAEETSRSGDSIESAPGGPRAWDGSVRAATRARRPPAAEPPGVNPRAEPWGVRTDTATAVDAGAETGADPSEPKSETGGGQHGPNAVSSHALATSGATKTRRTPESATQVEFVVTVTAAETGKQLGGADVSVVQGEATASVLRTRPDGTVHVRLLSGLSYALDVKARGRLRVRRSGVAPSEGTAHESVSLERGVVVHGFVRDDERRLRGAVVRAVALEAMRSSIPYGPDPPTIEETTTARDGSYVLDCIPRGVACVLVSEAEGHATDRVPIDPQPDPDYDVREDIVLPRGIAVVGRVDGPDEKPIEGAMVYAFETGELELLVSRPSTRDRNEWTEVAMLEQLRGAATDGGLDWLWRARTGKDGGFTVVIPSFLENLQLLALHADGGRSAPAGVGLPVKAKVNLALRGRVRAQFDVRTQKGQPAEGMTITPYFPWERWTAPARGEGLYGFASTEDGPILVSVEGPAGAPGTYIGRRTAKDNVRWVVKLHDGVTRRGTVIDDRNTLVAGATVSMGPISAVTGDEGSFELNGVHPEASELVAEAPGHPRNSVDVGTLPKKPIVARLPRQAIVRMRIVPPFGSAEPSWYRVSHGWPSAHISSPYEWEDRFAWGEGDVEIGGLTAKDTEVLVFVPGYQAIVRPIQPQPGIAIQLGTIELVPQPLLRGVVVDESGVAVANARVDARPNGTDGWIDALPARGADTNPDGSFELRIAVPSRKQVLLMTAPDFIATPQLVEPGTEPVRVVLGRGRSFAGRWPAHDGRRAIAVLLGPDDVEYGRADIQHDGTFSAEPPRLPRRVRIEARYGAPPKVFATQDVPADLAEGAILEIR